MRVAIVKTKGYSDTRVERVLQNNNIKGDIIDRINRNMLNKYNAIILSYKNSDIRNMPKLIEQLVLEKKLLVVYINNTMSIGHLYNVVSDIYFAHVNDTRLDIELPMVLHNSIKFIKHISRIELENKDLKNQLETIKLINKAKRILIKKGLTEEESHQFIQKKSMNMRLTKKEFVNLIIENKIDI